MLSYEVTQEQTIKLKEISELATQWAFTLKAFPESVKEAMRRYARVSNIGSTTRIENAVLTDVEVGWLDRTLSRDGRPTSFNQQKTYIEDKLSKDRERSIEEVAGCRNLLAIVSTQAEELFPLTETTIKGLHQEMLQFYPAAAHYLGRYKIASNSVVERVIGTSIQRDVLKTADPGPLTEAAMGDLVRWYNETLPACAWTVAVAAEFTFRFLAIHPFQDGNGRLSRALFALILLQSNDNLKAVFPYLALDRHIEKNKEEYYLVLRKCSEGRFLQDPKQYKMEYFLGFILKMLKEALSQDISFYHGRCVAYAKLTEATTKILDTFKDHPEKKLALKDVLQYAALPRSTTIRALNDLVKQEFLQKTGKQPAVKYQLVF
jgi:Fic family protein